MLHGQGGAATPSRPEAKLAPLGSGVAPSARCSVGSLTGLGVTADLSRAVSPGGACRWGCGLDTPVPAPSALGHHLTAGLTVGQGAWARPAVIRRPGRWGCGSPGTCCPFAGGQQLASHPASLHPSCVSRGAGVRPFLDPRATVCILGPNPATGGLLVRETETRGAPCRLLGRGAGKGPEPRGQIPGAAWARAPWREVGPRLAWRSSRQLTFQGHCC